MKIGIFGDSWASVKPRFQLDEMSWPLLLEEKYDVENFGESGSSLYFSASIFLKNYYKYDKIIFLVTDSSRLYLPEHSQVFNDESGPTRHVKENTPMLLRRESIINIKKNRQIADAIDMYYQYIWDLDKDDYYHRITISDIKSKVPVDKLLIIEKLGDLAVKEHQYYISHGCDLEPNLSNYREQKNCHLSQVNNTRFAELIDQWIQTPEFEITKRYTNSINTDLFFDPPLELFEKYYKKID